MVADLVLWSGDPLEVSSVARQVWLGGNAIPMRSRQTELRDRYLAPKPSAESGDLPRAYPARSEEHTSELQSLMRISYAVFCLKKKNPTHREQNHNIPDTL